MKEKIDQKGFIQIPLLIGIIVFIVVASGAGYGAIEYKKASNLLQEAGQLTKEEKYTEAKEKLELVQNSWLVKNLGIKKQEVSSKIEEIKIRIEEKKYELEQEAEKGETTVCIQVITLALSPDGVCKEFSTPCDVLEGWKKVDKCPQPSIAPLPTSTSTSTPVTQERTACCSSAGGCKLVDTKETCLGMSGKPMSISSCSPNPCPAPTPQCKPAEPALKDYKCADGTLLKWQCTCSMSEDGEEGWNCNVNPPGSCPAGVASLTISNLWVRYMLWILKEPTAIVHHFWKTNVPANSYIEYGPTASYGFTTGYTASPAAPTTDHGTNSFPERAQRNTTYHFRIVAEDINGNKVISDDYTFTVGVMSP